MLVILKDSEQECRKTSVFRIMLYDLLLYRDKNSDGSDAVLCKGILSITAEPTPLPLVLCQDGSPL